jgi:hypothetical protein
MISSLLGTTVRSGEVAYVREKKVPGKDGRSYSYYQLVEGKRVDGKVRQHVIAHLGKHPNIEAARAAAEALRHNTEEISPEEELRLLRLLREKEEEREREADQWFSENADLYMHKPYKR